MAVSADRTSGDTLLHGHFNVLREDILNVSTGHTHGGGTDEGKALVRIGTLASRPAAGQAGSLYIETDAGSEDVERDNGSSFDSFMPVDAAVGVGSMRTLGTSSTQAGTGDHAHS